MSGGIVTVADIGDSLTSEIQGGVDYGLDTISNNTTQEARPEDLAITYHQKSRKSFRTLILFFY
jgi:ribonucleotide monophosphatase NagD (HAD superfamily)